MPVALLNYLDRQMLASMKFSVMSDIPSIGSEENWGFMLGQFKWVYAAFSLIGGYFADRFSRRYAVCAGLFVLSAGALWAGDGPSFCDLLMGRSLLGISEGFFFPAAPALFTAH